MKKKTKPASPAANAAPRGSRKTKQMYLHAGPGGTQPKVARSYDTAFTLTPEYKESLPDMMEAVNAIPGANVPIQQVGISNFRLPLKFAGAGPEPITLEASVSGTASLAANVKGINMSRIMRSFYEHEQELFTPELLGKILEQYRRVIGTLSARLRVTFAYPILQPSLRSGLSGWQYYTTSFESTIDAAGNIRRFIEFDFVYSSSCPCSAELAEHARDTRGVYAIAHNQRSKARVKVELAAGKKLTVAALHAHCLAALKTETQVMVKREDEQAFAELNGAYIKFVEDAARLVYEQLAADKRIRDFQVVCAHLESLHSHDAVSVICKGVPGGFAADFTDYRSLIC